MSRQVLSVDNLCDRRQIYDLLSHLSPIDRVRFLKRCCDQCRNVRPAADKFRPFVREAWRDDRADAAVTRMVVADMVMLSCDHKLDFLWAISELERVVKRPDLLRA